MTEKYTFKAIMSGMFNAITVNRRLKDVSAALNELNSRIDALGGIEPAAVTSDESAKVAEAPVAAESTDTLQEEPTFDWQTSDDVVALKEFALERFKLEIKGNKKADTVRKEIAAYLEV